MAERKEYLTDLSDRPEFAHLGITGLSNKDTVAFYREQWNEAYLSTIVERAGQPAKRRALHAANKILSSGRVASWPGAPRPPPPSFLVAVRVAERRSWVSVGRKHGGQCRISGIG